LIQQLISRPDFTDSRDPLVTQAADRSSRKSDYDKDGIISLISLPFL